MSKEIQVYKNPFQGRDDGVVFPGRKFDSFDDKNIIDAYEKEIVKKTGDGEDDYVIEKKVVIHKTISRDKYINDAADDVGIMNVLRKVALSGKDLMDDNPYAARPGYVDMTKLPTDFSGAVKLIEQAKESWNKLPDGLKKNMDYETFIKTATGSQIYDYFKSQQQVSEPVKTEPKEDDK